VQEARLGSLQPPLLLPLLLSRENGRLSALLLLLLMALS
jgi:hypothetical protein